MEQNTRRPNDFASHFFAVFMGVMAAIAVFFLLIPLVKLVYDNYYGWFSETSAGQSRDTLLAVSTTFTWLFISSLAGGFVCKLISRNWELVQVVINSLVSIVLVMVLAKEGALKDPLSWVIILSIPLGNFFGAWIAGFYKKRKRVA